MATSSVSINLSSKGMAEVVTGFNLTPDTYIACFTYGDGAPIISMDDGPARVTLTVPDRKAVTGTDLDQAYRLADAVDRYVTELEIRLNKQSAARSRAA